MMNKTIRAVIVALALAAGYFEPAMAADDYPSRPITLIVPFAPGGIADYIGRLVGRRMEEKLGAPIIIQNMPGASGNIGARHVSTAKPDGYTLLLGPSNIVANVSLYKNFTMDPTKDLTPIGLIIGAPSFLLVNPKLPVKNVAEFIAYLKAKPGKINFATSGAGSPAQLAAVQFEMLTHTTMTETPYGRGSAPALLDLVAGRVQVMFTNLPQASGFIGNGNIKPLAFTGAERPPALPNVPTLEESGVSGFTLDSWYGLLGPKGLPPVLTNHLNAVLQAVLREKDVQNKILASGLTIGGGTPEVFSARIKAEIPKYAQFLKTANIAIR